MALILVIVIISSVKFITADTVVHEKSNEPDYYESVLLYPIATKNHAERGAVRSWYCGASVLHKRILLTAAHCVEFRDKPLGIRVLYEDVCASSSISIGVYKMHEYYDPETKANDIALLVTTEPIDLFSGIRRLAFFNHSFPRQVSTAEGWQIIAKSDRCKSTWKRFFQEKVKSRKCCRRFTENVPVGSFCVFLNKNDVNLLFDAAGVPVVIKEYIQIGIISFREVTKYGPIIIITNTTYFYQWITETSKLIYCTLVNKKCKCKDGQCKHLVILKDNAFIGSLDHAALRPPQLD